MPIDSRALVQFTGCIRGRLITPGATVRGAAVK